MPELDPSEQSPSTNQRTKVLSLLARGVLLALAVTFVVLAAKNLARDWHATSVEIAWGAALASCPPILVAGALQGLAWVLLIRRMAHRPVALGPGVSLFAASYLARYVPFKIGIVGVRVGGADAIGVPKAAVASSFLVEFLSWTVTGTLVGCVPLLLDPSPPVPALDVLGDWALVALAVSFVVVLVLVFVDRRRLPGSLLRLAKLERGAGPILPASVPLVHAGAWSFWVLHGFFVTVSVGASPAAAAAGAGFYVLAPVAGFLAVAAPAGAGVREAILALGIAPTAGAQGALAAAVISRAVTLAMDLAFWAVTRPMRAR